MIYCSPIISTTRKINKKLKMYNIVHFIALILSLKKKNSYGSQTKEQEECPFKLLWNQTPNETYLNSSVISMGFTHSHWFWCSYWSILMVEDDPIL